MKTRFRRDAVLVCFTLTLSAVGWVKAEAHDAKGPDQAMVVSASSRSEDKPGHRIPTGKVSDRFPNILLYTQDNKPVRLYDDLVKDKIVIVNFIYTTCQLSCVPTTANLALVHKLLGKRVGRDILMLSISLDPVVDTPKVLKEYAAKFGQFPGWYFLSGDYDEVDLLRHRMGVYDLDPVIDADKAQHAGIVTFGNDKTNQWAALPALMDYRGIVRTVLRITRAR